MMSLRSALIAALATMTLAVFPLYAQNVEIYRVDNLANELSEQDAVSKIATHLSITPASLQQEKAEYKITLGQLYFAHHLAKLTGSDIKAVMKEFSAGKPWSALAKEKNVKMDELRKDSRLLEDELKKAQRSSR